MPIKTIVKIIIFAMNSALNEQCSQKLVINFSVKPKKSLDTQTLYIGPFIRIIYFVEAHFAEKNISSSANIMNEQQALN